MAPNPRKRPSDVRWQAPILSKSPRMNGPSAPIADPNPVTTSLANVVASQARFRALPVQAPANTPGPVPRQLTQPSDFRPPLEVQRMRESAGTKANAAVSGSPAPDVYQPKPLHGPHPDSKLCREFHWVPYPLGLMPYDSWHRLHFRDDVNPMLPFRCPVCRAERKVSAHARKVFLVAERLSWDDKITSIRDKDLNEELNWKVNYELGILEPFVEDPEQIPGGKHSRTNRIYPYKNEREMKLALKLIFMTEDITETTWALWIGTQLDMQKAMAADQDVGSTAKASVTSSQWTPRDIAPRNGPELVEAIDLTSSPDPPPHSHGLPTPPSSFSKATSSKVTENLRNVPINHEVAPQPTFTTGTFAAPLTSQRIDSYKTLQDFYSLLDKIERTSYIGALFLEAYAEKLRDDMCKSCWWKHNVNLDMF